MKNTNFKMADRERLIERYGMSPEEYTLKFLDSIDFIPYFKKHGDVYSIMSAVEDDYNKAPVIQNAYDIFKDMVFNWISTDEFIEYIDKRYADKYRFFEHTTYIIQEL